MQVRQGDDVHGNGFYLSLARPELHCCVLSHHSLSYELKVWPSEPCELLEVTWSPCLRCGRPQTLPQSHLSLRVCTAAFAYSHYQINFLKLSVFCRAQGCLFVIPRHSETIQETSTALVSILSSIRCLTIEAAARFVQLIIIVCCV